MRAVLDPNVLISSLLSPDGTPARLLKAWIHGEFELVISPLMVAELARALAYPKLRKRIDPDEAASVVEWLKATAELVEDPEGPPTTRSQDPGDDYLIVLAEAERAALVSGDEHLLGLSDTLPVFSPAAFLQLLSSESSA